jgi:hypothetical protein
MCNCYGHRDSGSEIYSRTWLVLMQEAVFCFEMSLLYNLYPLNLVQLYSVI